MHKCINWAICPDPELQSYFPTLGFLASRRLLLLIRVLGTSARKPPLSDTLLWVTLSLAHPFEIEVIFSKQVEVLPKQRGREAQNIVVDHVAFSAELADYRPDVPNTRRGSCARA